MLTQVGAQMRWDGRQVALVGDGNEPPGAARRSELAKTPSSVGSTMVGASGAVAAGTRGSSSASATSGGSSWNSNTRLFFWVVNLI